MANILDNAVAAQSALEEVIQRTGDPAIRDEAQRLRGQISDWIEFERTYRTSSDDTEAADEVAKSADSMSTALRNLDLESVLTHGTALVGSLPGKPQSGQTPPWKR
jgi:hypothetical protein